MGGGRRVVVVSEDMAAPWDEGIKKFAYSVGRVLEADHEVRMINVDRSGHAATGAGADGIRTVKGTRTFLQPALRREVASFEPDVVIYVPSASATIASFLRAFMLRRHWPRARHGMVALIPRRHGARVRALLRGAAPDVVFVGSYSSLLHLCDLSVRGDVTAVGVDLARFRRARAGEKAELRKKYGVPESAFVFLHVGHIRPKRNLSSLAALARLPGAHLIVVGSTSTPEDGAVRAALEAAGARVVRAVVPVDEYYRLADAYVFPVIDSEGCVEIPLSVVEAMACGLPVIARPFGGLRDVVSAGEDVRYFESDDEMIAHARALQEGGRPAVRDMGDFAWSRVAARLVERLRADGTPTP